jgi:hypothetical protein
VVDIEISIGYSIRDGNEILPYPNELHIMNLYLTGRRIIEGYELQPFQLLNLVNSGLRPHDPATGEPIPCLTEAGYWLYTCERRLWKSAGLTLLIHDSSVVTSKITPEMMEWLPVVFYRALLTIARTKSPDSSLHETSLEGRPAKKLLSKIETWLLSLVPTTIQTRDKFMVTKALLQAASPRASIFDFLRSLMALDKIPEPSEVYDLSFCGELLSALVIEQNREALNHPLVGNILSDGFESERLADFCETYHEKAPHFVAFKAIELSEEQIWVRHSQRTIPDILRRWPKSPNSQRIIVLDQISRMIRSNFSDTPLPLRPEEYYIAAVPNRDYFLRLVEATYPKDKFLKINPIIKANDAAKPININVFNLDLSQTTTNHNNVEIKNHHTVQSNFASPNRSQPAFQEEAKPSSESASDPNIKEKELSPEPPPKNQEAEKYRELAARAPNVKIAKAGEAMALKVEGWPAWKIHRELRLKITDRMAELQRIINDLQKDSRAANKAEKDLKERQTQIYIAGVSY